MSTTADSDDRLVELVLRARAGDKDALGELLELHRSQIYSVGMRRLRNRAKALDLVQEVSMVVIRKIQQLRDPEKVSGWITRIAIRRAINTAARNQEKEWKSLGEHHFSLRQPDADPRIKAELVERHERVRQVIGMLRAIDQETLRRFYFEKQPMKQMGEEQAAPIGTIKRRLYDARRRFRTEIRKIDPGIASW